MKIPIIGKYKCFAGKIMMGLLLAAMIGNIDVSPAFGQYNHRGMGNHDRGRYENGGHGYDRGRYEHRGHDRGRYENRGHGYDRDRYVHGRHNYRPYGYSERFHLPLPGIGIFFPPFIFHP